jgi:peroxidase
MEGGLPNMTGKPVLALVAGTALLAPAVASAQSSDIRAAAIVRSLDGSANNLAHPTWGQAGVPYLRVATADYADGISKPAGGPPTRYVSNRIFNDVAQNLFSENHVSQWGFVWGQFVDHTIGLRQGSGGESAPIAFSPADPLETFRNDFGAIDFSRTPAAPGTGTRTPRQQINTEDSYIDADAVYSNSAARLEWLREGPVDGRVSNNGARLLLPGGLLPRRTARGNAAAAPAMELQGGLMATPDKAFVAGDVRANENIALTATQTLFAREHNRIVGQLPSSLSDDEKFEIARRVVGAEQQFITYNEFLPALGVNLSGYRGYDPGVNATLGNEFATVGYRAHSMIHGELEPSAPAGTYSAAQLAAFRARGIEVEQEDGVVTLVIPLNLAFGNPDLLATVGIGPVLKGVGGESEYRNDEMIDNQLRSVLFQIPKPGIPDPSVCLDGPPLPDCFTGVQDLGALDVDRGRDHGMPLYNDMRRAFGLAPKSSFTAITGESSESFPNDRKINSRDPINDPDILDFVQLRDDAGHVIPFNTEAADTSAVTGVRRTTTAARLKAIYGNVNKLDAFVGMVAEKHGSGSDLGELQRAMWKRQFEALRDGDRFFYLNDPALPVIEHLFGINYRKTLARVIELNTGIDVQPNVFEAPEE